MGRVEKKRQLKDLRSGDYFTWGGYWFVKSEKKYPKTNGCGCFSLTSMKMHDLWNLLTVYPQTINTF